MRACTACPGFVPAHLAACPHCSHGASRWRRLGRALAALAGSSAAVVTLAACYGAPDLRDGCPDRDGDGFLPGCYNEDLSCDPDDRLCDCDDLDPTIHPGAFDPPDDGVDRDCDGKDGQAPGGPWVDAGDPAPDAEPEPEPEPGAEEDPDPEP
jgi:hypothetical protein